MIIRNLTQSCIKEAVSLFASGEGSSTVHSVSLVSSWIQNIYHCLHNTAKAGKKPFLARRATAATSQRWGRLEQVIFCRHSFCFSHRSWHFFPWYVPYLPNSRPPWNFSADCSSPLGVTHSRKGFPCLLVPPAAVILQRKYFYRAVMRGRLHLP